MADPNAFTQTALGWIAAAGTILTAILGLLALLLPKLAALKSQVAEMKDRQQAQSDRLTTQEKNIAQVALATTPVTPVKDRS